MSMRTLTLLLAVILAPLAAAQDTSNYPLTLEVQSFTTVASGSYTTARQYNTIGSTTIATGGASIPRTAVINTAILTTPSGKLRCTVWGKKHYLLVETYHVRQISGDELEVLVNTKKGKTDHWKFKIISAEKME